MNIKKSIKLIEKWLDIPVEGGLDLDVSNAIELLIEFAKSQQWQPIDGNTPFDQKILLLVDSNEVAGIRVSKFSCPSPFEYPECLPDEYTDWGDENDPWLAEGFYEYKSLFPPSNNDEEHLLLILHPTHWMPLPQPPKDENK